MNRCEIHLLSQLVRKCHISIRAKEFLTELSCDTSFKIKFEALSLPEFCISKEGRREALIANH
jgi:hypothetical protein